MSKGILLLISLVSLFYLTGCTGVDKGGLELGTTEESTELTVVSEGSVQLQDAWVTVAELSVDMDGDSIEEMVTVEEQTAPEGYNLRVTGKKGVFKKQFKGIGLTAETHLLDIGTYGHSLLVILNETETANDSQEVRYYEQQQGAYIFDFVEGKLVPVYIEGKTISPEGQYRFALSLVDETLQIQDHVNGMEVFFRLDLTEDQKKNLSDFDNIERWEWFNQSGFNQTRISTNSKQLLCEKSIPGVMHQDIFATIRFVYSFVDGRWQIIEEYMISANPDVYAVQKITAESQTKAWDPAEIDSFYTADLETLLGYYHWSIDGAYAQSFASRLSDLYTELGVREFLRGLGKVEEKNVKGIAKLLIGERLIEFGEPGREELLTGFGLMRVISAMSQEEAKVLELVLEALDETSGWMKR